MVEAVVSGGGWIDRRKGGDGTGGLRIYKHEELFAFRGRNGGREKN